MRVLILANGDPPSVDLARAEAAAHDLLIAADGAVHKAAALGLSPDLVCGDFDSANVAAARREFPDAEFVETPDQNLADLEKALLLAVERGAAAATILGAGGGRIDHALAAVAVLARYHRDLDLALRYDGSTLRAVSGEPGRAGVLELSTRPGDIVSLIAFAAAGGVTVRGAEWPLEDARLEPGTHGVSNATRGESVTVEVREGLLLVCRSQAHYNR
jgi:thiamine pyrophosphokinase